MDVPGCPTSSGAMPRLQGPDGTLLRRRVALAVRNSHAAKSGRLGGLAKARAARERVTIGVLRAFPASAVDGVVISDGDSGGGRPLRVTRAGPEPAAI